MRAATHGSEAQVNESLVVTSFGRTLILDGSDSRMPHSILTLAQATGLSLGYYVQATYANLHSAESL